MLVYLSYPNRPVKPTWVQSLKDSLLVKEKGWAIFDSREGYSTQIDIFNNLPKFSVREKAEKCQEILKLNPLLLSCTPDAMKELVDSDHGELCSQILYKKLFALIRSDYVIADLNNPSYAAVGLETHIAWLLDIPIIGISYTGKVSPWIFTKLKAVIAPKNADDIIKEMS